MNIFFYLRFDAPITCKPGRFASNGTCGLVNVISNKVSFIIVLHRIGVHVELIFFQRELFLDTISPKTRVL
jgi:hypothetical protein